MMIIAIATASLFPDAGSRYAAHSRGVGPYRPDLRDDVFACSAGVGLCGRRRAQRVAGAIVALCRRRIPA